MFIVNKVESEKVQIHLNSNGLEADCFRLVTFWKSYKIKKYLILKKCLREMINFISYFYIVKIYVTFYQYLNENAISFRNILIKHALPILSM